ncbi:MAG: GntR family transcriptional regulator [Gammaproteobacteria bacterium]|nr:GntR family transcriptional regulator [Gammaproteobacteria bacterium]
MAAKGVTKIPRRQLVQAAAAKLRDVILAREPGTQVGSLNEVAELLGVGIVTVQQAARILEHEGLLAVRRGPGGGYYGTRPDEAALERAFAAYLRVHGFSNRESHRMLSLLDCEIVPAAALCTDESLRQVARGLLERVDHCESTEQRVAFETDLRDLLLKMVARPLVELVCRVTQRLYVHSDAPPLFPGKEGFDAWKGARRRILEAILKQDEELAQFEAERYRQIVLSRLRETADARRKSER